jgi:hypothetical protein
LPLAGLVACVAVAACGPATTFMVSPTSAPLPAPATIDHRLLLIGDAGDPNPDGEPTLHALEKQLALMPTRTTVVFLGDNVYETGMPEPSAIEGTVAEEVLDEALLNAFASRRDAERRVKAQVKAVEIRGARTIFVPGNHDWDQFGVGGWQRVRELERYIAQLGKAADVAISLLPSGGCPGPVTVDLGRRVRLIVLDTQWWLETGEKPSPENNPTHCPQTTEGQVVAALERALAEAAHAGRAAVVVGHHPLRTNGPHGGYVGPRVHLFPLVMFGSYVPTLAHWVPLPGLGTVAGAARAWFSPNVQDLSNGANEHMRAALSGAMEESGALMYAAGHDHSLQVFRGGGAVRYLVVSGLGSSAKALPVGHDRRSLFAHSSATEPGFMKVDFLRDGRVRLAAVVWTVEAPDGVEMWSRMLDAGVHRRRALARQRRHAPRPTLSRGAPSPGAADARAVALDSRAR